MIMVNNFLVYYTSFFKKRLQFFEKFVIIQSIMKHNDKLLGTVFHIFFTMAIYGIMVWLGKITLMVFQGVEMRFATFIPVVCGFMWGWPAALGVALGNMLADFLSDNPWYVILLGAYGNFLLAYLPRRLWYGFLSERTNRFIYDVRTLVKFTVILFLVAFCFSNFILGILQEMNGLSVGWQNFFMIFSSNFDFPMLFGTPVLLLFYQNWPELFDYPAAEPELDEHLRPQHGAFIVATVVSIGFFVLSMAGMPSLVYTRAYLGVIVLLLGYVCTLPAGWRQNRFSHFTVVNRDITCSFTWYMMVPVVIIMGLLFLGALSVGAGLHDGKFWTEMLKVFFVCINSIFLCTLMMMWLFEQHILKPYRLNAYAKQAIEAQLDIAASIQRGALPHPEDVDAKLDGYELRAEMHPAKEVGGDMYDCFLLDPQHLLVVIGDVSGKGVPAALFMMTAKAFLKSCAMHHPNNPGAILADANNGLAESNEQMLFVTVWLGIVDLKTGEVIYANAGHNPPVLKDSSGVRQIKQRSGPALGIMSGVDYMTHQTYLEPGAKLFIYTDGVCEAENIDKQLFGMLALEKALDCAVTPAEIMYAVHNFTAGAEQNDDITFIWLQRR